MSLPKINYPIYNIKIPSLKKSFKFRPFLVKEEKLLLMAKESQNSSDILTTVKQIVNNCCLDKIFNVDKLALFDLEYIFLKLRAFSVNNIVNVSYKDEEDETFHDFEVNLEKVEVVFPEKIENNIKITKNSGILMKYPPASLYDDKEFLSLDKDFLFELMIRCIDKIYENDTIYESKDYKKEELGEFLESLDLKVFEQIQLFLINIPKLNYELEYVNKKGNPRKIVLSSLNDFFTWR
jgi:hypothetical protein